MYLFHIRSTAASCLLKKIANALTNDEVFSASKYECAASIQHMTAASDTVNTLLEEYIWMSHH